MGKLSGAVCIFDLDGTLVDSAPDLSAALNRALARKGLAAIPPEEVRPLVGEGARALLREGYKRHGLVFPEDEKGDAEVAAYIDDYAANISDHSFVFEGVEESLRELQDEGARLAVCTNKLVRLAEPLLRDLGIRDFFEMVVCADSLPEKKPSPAPLLHIVESTASDRAVMVGDTATDLLAAEAAGIPSLIAGFGYGFGDPRLAVAETFDSFRELPGRVFARLSPLA
ncbi:HAD-IA family hydrolase [Parvularcula lutaonensis]|uniref:phosphoglycolate phosphatase n=1 Tax=Parvularcula lutaonensis TaxID=491923 RepID=A0ABV7MCD1_9PROT|nr:HAD-IA family hydrolase [Parvularcula lutaonensis]GGY38833.1 phosphoglycolate phosphatase [Parvularcula lutaonensis]